MVSRSLLLDVNGGVFGRRVLMDKSIDDLQTMVPKAGGMETLGGIIGEVMELQSKMAREEYSEEGKERKYLEGEIHRLINAHCANREARSRLNAHKSRLKEMNKARRERLIANRIREAMKVEGAVQSFFIRGYNNKRRSKILANGLMIDDRMTLNTLEISKHLKEVYYSIYNKEDAYREGGIERFLNENGVQNGMGRLDQTVAKGL